MTEKKCLATRSVVILGEDTQRASEISADLSARGWFPTVLDFQDGMYPSTLSGRIVVLQTSSINPRSVGTVLRLREDGQNVLVLVSNPQPNDGILYLQIGAADYVAEPADLREIELRLRIISKLTNSGHIRPQLELNYANVDFVERSVVRRDGKQYRLSETECRLLRAFIERNEPLSRDEIRSLIAWPKRGDAKSRVVDVLVSSLRQKLDDERAPSCIVSLRGRGYTFRKSA